MLFKTDIQKFVSLLTVVGIFTGEHRKQLRVSLKLIVTNYFRKAVYTQCLMFPAILQSHAPISWLMPS